MTSQDEALFTDAAWSQALQKFCEATRLTVVIYGRDGQVVRHPAHATPLYELFRNTGFDPGIFADCARQCLAQIVERPAVVVAPSYGLAVVGTSLLLAGEIVGAAVAGYAFIDFCHTAGVELLARQASVPFDRVWSVARVTAPLPARRLVVHGELLQVLGDAILRENYRARQYEKAAAAAEAAAAKDEFLVVISHELRTPLTPILLRAQMLHGERDPARIDEAAAIIERNVRLQARLVEDLLDLTRAQRGAISLALDTRDLGREVSAAVDSARALARERAIALDLAIAEEPLPVAADRDRLQQVLQNILGNALKFTPSGGTISVRTRSDGGSGLVSISDTGQGIAPEFLPFVFEMFRRGDQQPASGQSGLGIGLALVRRLVELHGGDIRVKSAGVGRGTEVLVRLPLGNSPSREGRSEALAELQPGKLAGLRIMVVEDVDDAREALRLLLEALGAQVSVARSGEDALQEVANAQPNVVLCDLQMPRMDGFEFIQRLCAYREAPKPPVIALTGTGVGVSRDRTRMAGFAGHLEKPIGARELVLAIESAVRATV